MSLKIDLKDKKILYELDHNSRQSNAEIAKKVGLSKDVVNYRIKKLEQNIIQGYYTIIDFTKLNYLSFRVYFKLLDASPEKEKEIMLFLKNHKNTFGLAEIEGPYDITYISLVKNIYEFEKFQNEFKTQFKQYIDNEDIAIFTKVHHFHRAYILNKKFDEAEPEFFGENNLIQYDELDINILKLLAKNSRIPTIEIAQKLNTPPRTIAFRIKQLEKKKIIQGYRFVLNFEELGYQYFKIDLILKDISRKKELISYARTHPNIIYVDETIGGSDFEFDLEVENKKHFLKIINELRIKFPEIRSWTYFTIRKYLKLLYFPEV
jgi:Lrp/AsnC family transcriptional regulator, regulator for asnA, asnC and gidA